MFEKISFKELHHIGIGRIAEYWTKLALTIHGLDVYTSEVDNKGLDFVARNDFGMYFDIQVKSIRYPSTSYVFITQEKEWDKAKLRNNLILALVLFVENKPPKIYLIPSNSWLVESLILKERSYVGKASKPEWGINISKRNMHLLEEFELENQVGKMK